VVRPVPENLSLMARLRSPEEMLGGLRRELERGAMRARNGIRLATGRIPDPEKFVTPHDVVWRSGRWRLLHYRPETVRYSPPLLLVFSLANRAYVFDMAPGNSFVERLNAEGIDVYLLDWGIPDERDAPNTVYTYAVEGIGDAIRETLRDSGADEVSLMGYCLGGILAVVGAAAEPEWPLRTLIGLTLPADMSEMPSALTRLAADPGFDPATLFDETGNLPGQVVEQAMQTATPMGPVTELADLVEGLWNEQYIEQYKVFTGWGHDQVPMAGGVVKDLVEHHIRSNTLATDGTFRLAGRTVRLADITVPFLSIVAEKDHLVPLAAAHPVVERVGSQDKQEVVLPGGHIGLMVGRSAHKRSIPKIVEFIKSRSDVVEPQAS
jgi:polyhydroxyalkanoate synthase